MTTNEPIPSKRSEGIAIYIPTFNRSQKLDISLSKLLACCDNRTEIIINDNCSTDDTASVVERHRSAFEEKGVRFSYSVNACNLGLPVNLLLAFHALRSKWVLMLGDDDIVSESSIEVISKYADLHPNASFFHFDGRIGEKSPKECKTAEDFIFGYHSYSHSFWMSTYVFNRDACGPRISSCAPFGIYSYAPHIAIALTSISEENPCYIIPLDIVSMNRNPAEKWAISPVALGLGSILYSPIKLSKRAYVRLRSDLFRHLPKPSLVWREIHLSGAIAQDFQRRKWLIGIFLSWFVPIVTKPRVLMAWLVVLILNESKAGKNFLLERTSRHLNQPSGSCPPKDVFERL